MCGSIKIAVASRATILTNKIQLVVFVLHYAVKYYHDNYLLICRWSWYWKCQNMHEHSQVIKYPNLNYE